MKNTDNKGNLVAPMAIRFSEKTDNEINKACEELSLSKQDIIRLAVDIGLRKLDFIGYDLADAIIEKVQTKKIKIKNNDSSSIALGNNNKIKTKVKKEK